MPLLAGVISSLFGACFSLLAKRMAMGVAAAAAFLAVSAAALAAAKLAMYALFATLAIAVPPQVIVALATVMPTHATQYIALIFLAQAIMVAFDYWRVNLSIAFQLANA